MIERLKETLAREDTVIFVGSGISLWSGLPTWAGLIRLLAAFVKQKGGNADVIENELKRNDFLAAAGYGLQQLTEKEIGQFVQKACCIDTAMPHEIHRKIVTLGPTCFVTTNYDRLLEASFQLWLPDRKINIVLNTQSSAQVDIKMGRAVDFLFKYHGDAGKEDSIILSRKQYRMVKSEGKLRFAFRTMQTLMETRPFVYIGFGLKDTDYWHIHDLILNTYEKGLKDHFAIMPDLTEFEIQSYKDECKIDVISYKTDPAQGKDAHASLLDLLDQLRPAHTSCIKKPARIIDKSLIFDLVRYAARFFSLEKPATHIPLIAFPIKKEQYSKYHHSYGMPIEQLLDNNTQVMILTGLPGSGKSFALRNSVARLAVELNQECLSDAFQTEKVVIPLTADLKLYQGNIWKLLEDSLPVDIELDFIIEQFNVKIFLDAFNEMPREYLESNHWNADFAGFLTQIGNASLVITSRTYHGLDRFDFPIYSLDVIDRTFVEQQLSRSQIKFKEIFRRDLVTILQRPFFYKLIFESDVIIDGHVTPKKVYDNLIHSINRRFQQSFSTTFDLVPVLSQVAVEAIDNGQEAFPIAIINAELSKGGFAIPEDVVNWLVVEGFLIAIPGEKVSFFHQSVTEYLAAGKLAELFKNDPGILKEKLQFTRWDHALLLVLNFLGKKKGEEFLRAIKKIDFDLALDAVRFLEADNKDSIIDKLLVALANRDKGMRFYVPTVKNHFPLTEYHIPTLRKLSERTGRVGGVAFGVLLDFLGDNCKHEGFDKWVEHFDDDDYCQFVCVGLRNLITKEDLPELVDLIARLQNKVENHMGDEKVKLTVGPLVYLFQLFDLTTVYETLYNLEKPKEEQYANLLVLKEYLRRYGTNDALVLLLGISEKNAIESFYTLYHFKPNSQFGKDPRYFSFFQSEHLPLIAAMIEKEDDRDWQTIPFVKMLCHYRRDFLPFFKDKADESKGALQLCYLYVCSVDNDFTKFFSTLEEFAKSDATAFHYKKLAYLSEVNEIDWRGYEQLLVNLLKHENELLVYAIYRSFKFHSGKKMPFVLDIGPVDWWLNRFAEIFKDKNSLYHHVPLLLFKCIPEAKKMEFIAEFNKTGSPYRKVLVRSVLPNFETIQLNDFNEDAIQYLLNWKKENGYYHHYQILESIATEEFTVQRIIPLLKGASGRYLELLKSLLEQLGNKHKRRYLL